MDRERFARGFAGVYPSFLLHAEVVAIKSGLKTVDILVERGRRKMVGGQANMRVTRRSGSARTYIGTTSPNRTIAPSSASSRQ
jgi:hypothetical protein